MIYMNYSNTQNQAIEQVVFVKANRTKCKLKLNLNGPAGSGKTFTALTIASSIGKKIAVLDTENESASFYADFFDFDVLSLTPPYTPERYVHIIHAAKQQGYDVLIIDSATHEWTGSGGCLEQNERAATLRFKGNTWAAWSETTPRHRDFIDAIVQADMHIITTTRSKTETTQEGKKIIKLGIKPEQRDGFEYELSTALDVIHENHFVVPTKDRTFIFNPAGELITPEIGPRILAWLNNEKQQEQALQDAFEDAVQRINQTTDIQELYLIHIRFKGTSVEKQLIELCKNRKKQLQGGEK